MAILGVLVSLYIVALLTGKVIPKQNPKALLVLVLVTAAQVAFVLHQLFTIDLPKL